MEGLGVLLGVTGMLAIAASLFLFIPVKSLEARRPLAKRLGIGGIAAFVVGLIVTPSQPGAPPSNATKAADASPAPPPSPTPTAAVGTDPSLKRAVVAQYRAVIAAAGPCDRAFKSMSAAGGNQLAMYQAASAGQEACSRAADEIAAMEAPDGLADDASEAQTDALATCRYGYRSRRDGFAKAMELADAGQARPSQVTAMQEDFKAGEAGLLMCVGKLLQAGGKAGVDMKDFK